MAVKLTPKTVAKKCSEIDLKLANVRKRLAEIERKHQLITERQDRIDECALNTISAMSFLQGKLETLKDVCQYEKEMKTEVKTEFKFEVRNECKFETDECKLETEVKEDNDDTLGSFSLSFDKT